MPSRKPSIKYLPDLAGIQLLTAYPGVPFLAPEPGAMVMLLWAAAFLAVSSALFVRRDIGI